MQFIDQDMEPCLRLTYYVIIQISSDIMHMLLPCTQLDSSMHKRTRLYGIQSFMWAIYYYCYY